MGVAKQTDTNVWTVVSEDLVQGTLIPISVIFKSNSRLFRLAEQAIDLYLQVWIQVMLIFQDKVQIVSLSKEVDHLLCLNDKNEVLLKEEQNGSHEESVFSKVSVAGTRTTVYNASRNS